ncbi:hypothetical protein NDU88_005355 [Pleurodeles waltl]|uniref:Uncharacterized protein n=1 Tax=Pleurodeles waltl TaxID=8319 RepID=A0AAV7LMJ6_PLEWA|nr:hypothetical protein NDU88_005355 [Pleurodeles waltl]
MDATGCSAAERISSWNRKVGTLRRSLAAMQEGFRGDISAITSQRVSLKDSVRDYDAAPRGMFVVCQARERVAPCCVVSTSS